MDATIEAVTITARRLRVIDKRNRDRMWHLLLPVFGNKDAVTDLWTFVNLANTTDSISGVDFQIPDPDAGFNELEQAWIKFGLLDDEVVQGWIGLHNQVNASPNERQFLPPDQLTDEEKKSGLGSEAPIE